MTRRILLTILLSGLLLLFLFVACYETDSEGDTAALDSSEETTEPAPVVEESCQPVHTGEVVLKEHCQSCHGDERVMDLQESGADWEAVVGSMEENGVVLTEDEHFYLVSYLDWRYR